MSLQGPDASICDNSSLQDVNDTEPCYYESYIKGSGQSVFSITAPTPHRNVHIVMNRLLNSNQVSTALVSQTDYQVLCFAEDDWPIEASSLQLSSRSPSFLAPTLPNKVSLTAVHSLRELIGTKRTLDETPPNFTQLVLDDPTTYNDRIIVAFALNEPGTAYCRATRSDSGETSADMPVVRILGAGWSAAHNGSTVPSIITMTKLENIDPALTNREDHNIFIDEARPPISEWRSCVSPSRRVRHLSTMSTAWPRMCMNASVVAYACCNHLQSEDDATDDRGLARPNIMTAGYISADVGDPLSPQGGRTAGATFHITQAIVTVIFTSRFRSCWHL
ncbi:unnamed protein product [Symbiodinium microadriaticum]|nr:unnamed protein product [Symbiodinium microadriaticum]CAE7840498.1 unnamed protein product [Symbiodinium sp. KB8]